jgi:hypothetical protein
MNGDARNIIASCQRHLPAYFNDCSGLVRAVANDCGVFLMGNANQITDQLSQAPGVLSSGAAAARAAAAGKLVVGGVKADKHGHVVIVVDGPLHAGKYPYCIWGQYHGLTVGGKTYNIGGIISQGTADWAFGADTRDTVTYAAFPVVSLLLPQANENEGYLADIFR